MEFKGINTNNLKNINVELPENQITLIDGPSGSGKSSLAFDTIARLCQDEFSLMSNENYSKGHYSVVSYSSLLPMVAIKQQNFNINPRSSIMSYFGLEPSIIDIFCFFTALPPNSFVINDQTKCDHCNGSGYLTSTDIYGCIDTNLSILDNPFECWKGPFEPFYKDVLTKYCDEHSIDQEKRFYDLRNDQQDLLINGRSIWKKKMRFFVNGYWCTRTWGYVGLTPFLNDESKRGNHRFDKNVLCQYCHGAKLTQSILNTKLTETLNVGAFLTMPFSELNEKIKLIHLKETENGSIKNSLSFIKEFLANCLVLNLGHLSFTRSIPTLSGGELQRLKMVPLLSGKITNIGIVLDEPTQSLYPSEALSLIPTIKKMSKQNTIILIDHNSELKKIATTKYTLGPGSGKNGGYITETIEKDQPLKYHFYEGRVISEKRISSDFVNFSGSLKLICGSFIGICGKSGIGKSVLLKTVLPRFLPSFLYVDQKPIKGNVNSTVASYTGILDQIKKIFAAKFRVKPSMFSYTGLGRCNKCRGLGHILVGDFDGTNIYETCDKCDGKRYSSKILKYKIDNKSISDYLSMTVDEILEYQSIFKKNSLSFLKLLSNLGLGHLMLNQSVSSLSGGENQRLKLAFGLLDRKTMFIGIDEPSKGLDDNSTFKLVNSLYLAVEKGKTVYCVDHNPILLSLCSYLIELQKEDTATIVAYEGKRTSINNCKQSDIKNYLLNF